MRSKNSAPTGTSSIAMNFHDYPPWSLLHVACRGQEEEEGGPPGHVGAIQGLQKEAIASSAAAGPPVFVGPERRRLPGVAAADLQPHQRQE